MKQPTSSRRAAMSKTWVRIGKQGAAPVPVDPAVQTMLPAMTFGQLRMLTLAGAPPSATIRRVSVGYIVELDVGPRRWILISTHSKRPRVFQHLDGAANAMRSLGAQPVHLELEEAEASPTRVLSSHNRT